MFDRPEETRWTQLMNPPTGNAHTPTYASISYTREG